jgi:hypothetical protein
VRPPDRLRSSEVHTRLVRGHASAVATPLRFGDGASDRLFDRLARRLARWLRLETFELAAEAEADERDVSMERGGG